MKRRRPQFRAIYLIFYDVNNMSTFKKITVTCNTNEKEDLRYCYVENKINNSFCAATFSCRL